MSKVQFIKEANETNSASHFTGFIYKKISTFASLVSFMKVASYSVESVGTQNDVR